MVDLKTFYHKHTRGWFSKESDLPSLEEYLRPGTETREATFHDMQVILDRLQNEIDPFLQNQGSQVEATPNSARSKRKCKNLISKIEEAELSDTQNSFASKHDSVNSNDQRSSGSS